MRVIVVGFVGSIHAVRAVEPMVELGWDVHVFASHPHWANPAWRGVTLHLDPGYEPPELDPSVQTRWLAPPPGDGEAVVDGLSWRQRVGALAACIEQLRPDLVDSMEIQHGGYLVLEARTRLPSPPPWLVHNWGSDVFYYGRNPRHVERLRGVLGACDYYGAECHRDVGLARAFGFSGRVLPVLPNPGGFDLEQAESLRRPGPTSERRTIALKATNLFVYRPLAALDALAQVGDQLAGYRLALYTATDDVEQRAGRLCERVGMDLEVVSRADAPVPQEEILALHGRSRVSISLSLSDAICTSFLEAMTMGSFPVQSATGCSSAWAGDGDGALFVGPEDVEEIAAALRRALLEDDLVDRAAVRNAEAAAARLDRRILLPRSMDVYKRLESEVRALGAAPGLDPAEMARELGSIAAAAGIGSPGEIAQVRREALAMEYLDPGPGDSLGTVETLGAGAASEDREALAGDLAWVLERQRERSWGESVGWAAGAIAPADRIEVHYDGELVERDAHVEALRRHVAGLQRSLGGFHSRLERGELREAGDDAPEGAHGLRGLARRVRARVRARLGDG